MKKLVSTLAATMIASASLVSASTPTIDIPVLNKVSFPVYAAEDLGTLASSLGADTDYLNIPYMWWTSTDSNGKAQYSDKSYYIAIMEVLAHNGELEISDLRAGASKMSDIKNSPELNDKMTKISKERIKHTLYDYEFKKAPAKEKIPALLATAEKASANNEYFHIAYSGLNPDFRQIESSPDMTGHHATGIGITDGSWTFNGKSFDKCILTLDSVNTADGADAFSEDTCIYVNSETNDYYIPKYSDSATEDIHIVAMDSDTMLHGDTSDLFHISGTKFKTAAFYTITSRKDGVETVRNRENEYLDYCHDAYNGSFYLKADSLNIDRDSYEMTEMTIENDDTSVVIMLDAGKSTFNFDGKAYSLTGNYNSEYASYSKYDDSDYFSYKNSETELDFYGKVLDDFYFEPADGKFLIDEIQGIRLVINSEETGNIFVSEKTEVRYDENGISGFFIDKDKDGVFEHRIETGDVNCDGKIDASDASLVLQEYSSLSASKKKKTSLNNNLADCDNDGKIDSSDASFILSKYAELSTTK
ncbi:MAG: hypothetical protein K2I00_00005 [Ruminococcus sp.]|nr:hypothetical protein [Ruminococcus sp.]